MLVSAQRLSLFQCKDNGLFQILLLIRCIISFPILLLLAIEVLSFDKVGNCKLSPKNSNIAKLPNDQNDI